MKIYSYDISHANKSDFIKWFNGMSEERKEKVIKLAVSHKQKLKIAADYLCRKAVSEFCGIRPEQIEFSVTGYGKPYISGFDVHFSISHSGDMVVCAVSDKETGIDIEKIRKINPRSSQKFASESEEKYINTHENGFFKIWTLKEAYFKCIGTGLGSDIKKVSFDISENGIICSEKGFNCLFHQIAEGYICSTCEKNN